MTKMLGKDYERKTDSGGARPVRIWGGKRKNGPCLLKGIEFAPVCGWQPLARPPSKPLVKREGITLLSLTSPSSGGATLASTPIPYTETAPGSASVKCPCPSFNNTATNCEPMAVVTIKSAKLSPLTSRGRTSKPPEGAAIRMAVQGPALNWN